MEISLKYAPNSISAGDQPQTPLGSYGASSAGIKEALGDRKGKGRKGRKGRIEGQKRKGKGEIEHFKKFLRIRPSLIQGSILCKMLPQNRVVMWQIKVFRQQQCSNLHCQIAFVAAVKHETT